MSRFKSEDHRNTRAVLICYKFSRRRGANREVALKDALARHARLSGAFALLHASNYAINPMLLAAQANVI